MHVGKRNSWEALRFIRRPLLLCATLAGCREPTGVGAPPAHSTAVPQLASATSSTTAAAAPAAPQVAPWVTAVRLSRFREADKLLEALDDAEKQKPEMRFLRARVASELGNFERVRPLLEGVTLPLFEEDMARLRAEAAAEVGPYREAAQYFEKTGKVRDLVRAARALAKEGDTKQALALADRALADAQRLRRSSDERAAHAARADLLTQAGRANEAITDQKWLLTRAPETTDGRAARKALESNPKAGLTDKDKRAAIDALLEAGAGKDALELLERWGRAYSGAELAHKRAEALFKSRDYKKAAEAFLAASKQKSGRTAEQLYYAARSLARIKKETEALERYQEVVRRYRKEMWAERASYQRALLLQNQGNYAEAAQAFTEFLAKFPKSADRHDAEYALALAHLSAGQPGEARKVFGKLASGAKKTDWGVYRELEGVASLRIGNRDEAITIFTQVATAQPLTFAAQISRARLVEAGAPLPPLIEPPAARTSAPLSPALPEKVARLVALGLDEDAEAQLATNEAEVSAPYGGRETEALCSLYGQLSRAKRRYKVGANAVSFEALMRAPSPADRWSWDCLYPAPYADRVSELEAQYKLPPGLVHALMRQESGFDPEIRSPVGAQGLLQLMPTTAQEAAKEAGIEGFEPGLVTTPEVNLQLGSFYIAKMLKTFEGSAPLAAAGYNAGPKAVSRWLESAKEHEADVFVARIPYEETRNYVVRVMGNLARYQWLAGGDSSVAGLALALPKNGRAGDDDY
ncbi:MAG: transglycosylase SLT domain-containing protein [Myxococcales bacterium]|nr:transglycosylase SLT domain-containing protein [Myxococcales bacterium]